MTPPLVAEAPPAPPAPVLLAVALPFAPPAAPAPAEPTETNEDPRRAQRTRLLLGQLRRLRTELRTTADARDLGRLDARRVLVLAPHPDDEVIGCGALIQRRVAAGAQVTVVFITQEGARSIVRHQGEPVRRRVVESRRAVADLGVVRVAYLELEELSLSRDAEAYDRLRAALAELIGGMGPGLVLAPGDGEMHPDHRAVCRATLEAMDALWAADEIDLDTPVALYEVWGGGEANAYLRVAPAEMAAKRLAMGRYASQTETADYLAIMELLHETRGRTLAGGFTPAEGYFLLRGAEEARARLLNPTA
ncbi:MAG TPA: PIG-L family deacetylase [Longimicrobium sp.]|uniref:PIG-L deacetylase family protein n=1 Tax=Longimicrobium sp. TaxID=2029185 RepID=UPI002EDA2990